MKSESGHRYLRDTSYAAVATPRTQQWRSSTAVHRLSVVGDFSVRVYNDLETFSLRPPDSHTNTHIIHSKDPPHLLTACRPVCTAFLEQIAEFRITGLAAPLQVPNISSRRPLLTVPDSGLPSSCSQQRAETMFGGRGEIGRSWQRLRFGRVLLLCAAAICRSQAFLLPSCEPSSPPTAAFPTVAAGGLPTCGTVDFARVCKFTVGRCLCLVAKAIWRHSFVCSSKSCASSKVHICAMYWWLGRLCAVYIPCVYVCIMTAQTQTHRRLLTVGTAFGTHPSLLAYLSVGSCSALIQ